MDVYMFLARADLVHEIMREFVEPFPPHAKSQPAKKPAPPTLERATGPSGRREECRCGICVRCRDNQRWERIFAEKFADPNYYQWRQPKCASSLSSWR